MPLTTSPLRIQATARSLSTSIGLLLNRTVSDVLEPDFKYQYEPPSSSYREIFALLPLAISTRQVTISTKIRVLRRVVLRDHDSLTRFFITIIKSPECAWWVKELHCHLDLSQHTSAERLSQDIALVDGIIVHLTQCPISLDILICIRERMVREVEGQPYHPTIDIRFRQAMFLSLLGHLRNLDTLRITIYGQAETDLSWLRYELQQAYPADVANLAPCLFICPSLKRLTLCPADDYQSPFNTWHPLALWPLIDLPRISKVEIDNNPSVLTGIQVLTPFTTNPQIDDDDDTDDDDDDQGEEEEDTYASFAYLQTLRIKNYLPHTHPTLHRIFSAMQALHTLEICGSVVLPLHDPPDDLATADVNLNTLLSIPSVARTLQYLSIDDACPTPESAMALFGPGRKMTAECLVGLGELRGLYIHSFALFGAVSTQDVSEAESGGQGEGMLPVGVPLSVDLGVSEETAVCLPPKLERLEVVEDRDGGTRWTGAEDSGLLVEMGSGGKMTGVLKSFAGCCAQGMYPALKHVVLWCHMWGDERYDWATEAQEEVRAMLSGAGIAFEFLPYEPWPKGKVGGWKSVPGGEGNNGG